MEYQLLPHIVNMDGYTPGEQPQSDGYIKLNTNESPYPCSPKVVMAIAEECKKLRLYPQPMSNPLRDAAAELYGFDRECILAGNGSDDLLTMLARVFISSEMPACAPVPTYTLYRTLAQLQNSRLIEIPFPDDYSLPIKELSETCASVAFIANPNSPTGTMVSTEEIAEFARKFPGFVVVDEAYADFADWTSLELAKSTVNVGVLRTFSKSYSLAGLRVGLFFAGPELIEQMTKVKDSYNLDRLAIAGAAAALRDREHFNKNISKIRKTRGALMAGLAKRGFKVLPSQSNFVLAEAPAPGAKEIYRALKERKVLVRYFEKELPKHLRISVGADDEINRMFMEMDNIIRKGK